MLNEIREKTLNDLLLLERSIVKWENIAYNNTSDDSIDDCALCKEYYHRRGKEVCEGCPVKNLSGQTRCNNTPYAVWLGYQERREYPTEDCTEDFKVFDETSKQLAIDMGIYLVNIQEHLKHEILAVPALIGFDPGKGDTSVSHNIQ